MRFTVPLWGFSQTEFALLPASRQGVWWFVSTAEPTVTFVLADPFVAMTDYVVDVNDGERETLALQDENDALVLVMLVMPAQPGEPVTGNFRAPLIFNLRARQVMQVVNRDDRYQLTTPVDLTAYPLTDNAAAVSPTTG